MAEKGKGSFGYLKKQAVKQGIITLIMIAICATIFLVGFLWLTDFATIFTVIAVLGMLPAAKSMVSMIIFMKAEKFSCSDELHNRLVQVAGSKAEELLCGFDFYLTSYDKNFPLCAVLIRKGSLIAYTPWEKCDCNQCKAHFEEYMKKNGISGINIKIFSDENKFIERFSQLCEEKLEPADNEKSLYRLLLNLSI